MAKKLTKKKKSKRKKLSPQEKAVRREQNQQKREIRTIFKNLGFSRLSYIDGKHFQFDNRTSEMDDIYINENIILISEYTIGNPNSHLFNKKVFYDKINSDKRAFIEFMLEEEKLSSFRKYFDENIKGKYSINEIRLKILYCSKKTIPQEHKAAVENVIYFDHHVVKYFKSLTKVIKKSSKYEFLEFIDIPFSQFGDNIKNSSKTKADTFSGHILPEERSYFEEGHKIVSFYIDAASLIKRAYVLRQNGWRDKENVGHYQRMFESKKISDMRKYLTERKRVFINNIISTISIDKVRLYDEKENELSINDKGQFVNNESSEVTPAFIEIKDECNIIGLIDGQHRTYAYHEGDDQYEDDIAKIRGIQNLLVTGILFPRKQTPQKRLKFEAKLFLEINSNQTNVKSQLKQEIELLISPFSTVAIGKRVLQGLNKSGPLNNLIEEYWYEKGKIKTASIVSFGLKPLIKLEDVKASDSIFSIWNNPEKNKIKQKNSEEYELLEEYIEFSVNKIRDLLIPFKANLLKENWETYNPGNPDGLLTVTFFNGILNVLRLLIENGKVSTPENYSKNLKGIDKFEFKRYKSSQYRQMGSDIYEQFFNKK